MLGPIRPILLCNFCLTSLRAHTRRIGIDIGIECFFITEIFMNFFTSFLDEVTCRYQSIVANANELEGS